MTTDAAFYDLLVDALKVLGEPNVRLVLQTLETENVIQGHKVDREKLEPALRSIFGDGAKVFLEFAKSARTTQ